MTTMNLYSKEQVDTKLTTKANSSDLATVATTGAYSDLSGTPNLATVATSGSYTDLSNKPTIPPAVTVDSVLDSVSENPVQNKVINTALGTKADTSSLATVATTGSYTDLLNKPTIPSGSDLVPSTSGVSNGFVLTNVDGTPQWGQSSSSDIWNVVGSGYMGLYYIKDKILYKSVSLSDSIKNVFSQVYVGVNRYIPCRYAYQDCFSIADEVDQCIDEYGNLFCRGNNSYGQQGAGNTTNVTNFTYRASNVKDVVVTRSIIAYITNDDVLYMAGYNAYGQQGAGNTTDVTTFTQRATNVKKVIIPQTDFHTCFYITNDNRLFGTGRNAYGQQGAGNTTDVTTFTQRATNVKECFGSHTTTYYITYDDKLYGCGVNSSGQLGDGTTTNQTTFKKIADNVKKAIYSYNTLMYLTNDNELYATGQGYDYVRGDGTNTNISTPELVASNVKDFILNNGSTQYVDFDCNLYSAGNNIQGCLGNGTTTDIQTFTKVAENVKTFFPVAHSDTYVSFYISNDNELYGCGSNGQGYFNNGGSANNQTTYMKLADDVEEFYSYYPFSYKQGGKQYVISIQLNSQYQSARMTPIRIQ